MKPPNITPPPDVQPQAPSQQQPPPAAANEISGTVTTTTVVSATTTSNISAQSPTITTKTPQPAATQVQQAPLALTAQPQTRPQLQATPITQQLQNPSTTVQSQQQPMVIQPKIQPTQLQAITATTIAPTTTTATTIAASVQPITLTTAPNSTGPTALVIIPQHSTNATVAQAGKAVTIAAKSTPITTAVGLTTAHVTLAGTTQSTPIQLQTATTTPVTNITTPVPIAAHQQSNTAIVQPTLTSRPPSTLPIVPITAAPATQIKSEQNKYICCLLDNGIRCERVAGNASFSARIQKIVGTKKMNYALDPTVRHAYICEHHKAIITVAKKSTTLARDTKSNARNYTANNNANTLASQPNSNFNDLSMRQQQALQHPVNMELMTNQNRLVNNHTGTINNVSVRPGTQIAYGHYPGGHPNQVGSMDVMMSTSFDNAGGDSVPSCSGGVDVDLQQLQVNTLRRYKRHFRVQTRPGLNKLQLAESLKSHFRTLPIIEKEAITYFVYIVKCYRNKLDHNPKAD